jgi:aminoglycoside phosphotransferase (APT) family kinase protein
VNKNTENLIDGDVLQKIWDAHGLGRVRTIQAAKRGSNNRATVVNDAYVIRFDVLDLPGVCRYLGEQLAYERLHVAGVPAPKVVALVVSKSIIPYHYIILTKIEGRPLIDDWTEFSESQRREAGETAGRYLAMMHDITFDGFGDLLRLPADSLPNWYAHVDQFFERYGASVVARQILDEAVYRRMRGCIDQMRPTLEALPVGRLVHSDYQFENLLHRDGVITGIIDFEWALSGDPIWDFKLEEQWDSDCPGSTAYIYAGYTSLRRLADDHVLRMALYKVLFHLDSVDMYAGDSTVQEQFDYCFSEIMRTLAVLEANLW